MDRVFNWIKECGGVEVMEKNAIKKSQKIYNIIDKSDGFYKCPIDINARSKMNIPFRIRDNDEELEKEFLSGAVSRGMLQLKGHRSIEIYSRIHCSVSELMKNDIKYEKYKNLLKCSITNML